jgi:CheY-like chemotaxis protein
MDIHNKKERRKGERFPAQGSILIGNAVFKCIDISEGGLYLYTEKPYEENKVIQITFPIKDKPLTVKVRVQHSQPGIGMGLKFIALTYEQKKIIASLIRNILKKFSKHTHEQKKILLVEDNDMSRQIHKNRLLMEGYSVTEARDGVEAVNLLKQHTPDLMIFDLHMKKIDGFKVLTILRNHPKWEKIPVIVFSAHGTPDLIQKVIKAGATEFIYKMLTSPAKLAETVKTVLQTAHEVRQ